MFKISLRCSDRENFFRKPGFFNSFTFV